MNFTKEDTSRTKGAAIIPLLFHHCFVGPERYSSYAVRFPLIPESAVNHLAMMARICVAVFTFLSAYGMTLSYQKRMPVYTEEISGSAFGRKHISAKQRIHIIFQEYRHRLVALIGSFSFLYVVIVLWGTLVMRDGRIQNYGTGGRRILYIIIDALGLAGIAHTPTYLFTWWYESLAVVVILILPILIFAYRTCGSWILLGAAFLFAVFVPVDNTPPYEFLQISNYLFCICLGILAADRNWMVRIRMLGQSRLTCLLKCLLELCGIAAVLEMNLLFYNTPLQVLTEGAGALLIVCFCYEYLGRIPGIGRILKVCGSYSGTIYVIHNMIRGSWCSNFIYGFHYPVLIVAVLLAVSLVLSVLLQKLEHLLHYDKLLLRLR